MPGLQDTLLSEFQQIQGAVADSTEAWSSGGGGTGAGGSGRKDTAPRGDVDSLGNQTGAIADSTEAWSSGGGGTGAGGSGQKDTAPRGDVDSLGDQTGAIDYGRSSSSSSSSSSGGALGGIGGALAAGLGIIPLGLEIASLFEGGSSTPPPLTRYAMPDSVGFTGSTDDSGANSDADFGQMGQPRSYGTPAAQVAGSAAPSQSAPSSGGGSQGQAVQITVQAMDAQSIMDRSDDIASAVNKAILAMHPIADTISNL